MVPWDFKRGVGGGCRLWLLQFQSLEEGMGAVVAHVASRVTSPFCRLTGSLPGWRAYIYDEFSSQPVIK